ncbi:hypothetical protein D1224_02635 [Henriciella barbarensis]|uniref:Uncharacterized protein n=1 Tax=Henriciella barbarensis TaxID=86342 RepID=A0A399R451_9PROT|nr:hypothetical protein D1224_02635 [Henriciella barbarensis]
MVIFRCLYGAEALAVLAVMTVSACSGEDGRSQPEIGRDETIEDPVSSEDWEYEPYLPPVPDADRLCIYSTHDCGIENPTAPEYPKLPEFSEATCDTSFVVGEDGFAQDISVECDDPRFSETTREILSHLRYKVTDLCGRTCPDIGRRVDYPIEYRLAD